MNARTEAHLSALSPAAALTALRETSPLVQCITNAVVTNYTANALLAVGAAPAMCDIPGEAGLFAGVADGVLVNLGTPTAEQRDAAREAVRAGTPWVLDPHRFAGGLALLGGGGAEVHQHAVGHAGEESGLARDVAHGGGGAPRQECVRRVVRHHCIGDALHQGRGLPQRRQRGGGGEGGQVCFGARVHRDIPSLA